MEEIPGNNHKASSSADVLVRSRIGRYRVVLVLILSITMVTASFDRISLSLALVDGDFLRTLGIEGNSAAQGMLLSAFVLVYAVGNLLFSPLVDVIGARRALIAMLALWSALAVFLGSASSFAMMVVGRGLRGAAEGPIFPTMNRFTLRWFPKQERGRANAVWVSGNSFGLAVAAPVLAAVILAFGWRAAFFTVAALLVVVALPLVFFFVHNQPSESSRVEQTELDHIQRGTPTGAAGGGLRWSDAKRLFGDYRYWFLTIYHLGSLSVLWGLVSWLPKYLVDARGVEVAHSGWMTALPYLLGGVLALLFGFISDHFDRQAPFCALQMVGSGVFIFVAASVESAMAAVLLLSVALGFWGLGSPLVHTLLQRIVPAERISTGSGIENGIANLGAATAPALIGLLIAATGTYYAGLMVLVGFSALGAVFMIALALQKY